MSLKNSMINKLRNEARWVHSGELENFSMECGYKAETGGRVLRKLEEEGLIHKQYDKKGCVWYREGQNLTEKRIWSSALNQIVKTFEPIKVELVLTFGDKRSIHRAKYEKK